MAGSGALVALIVSYRKQKIAEADSAHDRTRVFNERFATIATQLGDESPAVRLAAVHSLAGLADDWEENRQTCIDVLCAYLRMPYEPDPGEDAAPAERLAFQSNRQVRHTVIRIITGHLTDGAPVSWQGKNFDFTGSTFAGGDFSGAVFSDGTVNFYNVKFSDGTVSFNDAKFSGGTVSFSGAAFSGGTVSFNSARFTGSTVSFNSARFTGSTINFNRAKFTSGIVSFSRVRFTGGHFYFSGAAFSGSTVNFSSARFTGSTVHFPGAAFSGATVRFNHVKFTGGTVDLSRASKWSLRRFLMNIRHLW